MRVTVVGCAGSFAGPASPASSYLVQAEDATGRTWSLLLDLGNGAFGALQREVDPLEVDAVGISHLHPDHFVDLCGLYVYLRYHPERGAVATGTSRSVPVLGPGATHERLRGAYGMEDGEDFEGVFRFGSWSHGAARRIGPMTLTPVRVEHPVEAYALRVHGPGEDGGEVTFVYSGDTDECPGVVEAARGADLLLLEAAFVEGRDRVRGVHLTGRRAGRVAAQAGVGRTVLTHLPAWTDPADVLAEACAVYDGELELAAQGTRYLI
ncbi:MAG: MBL fold metallo-hydrolase [Cellulomonadaceae bacterium]